MIKFISLNISVAPFYLSLLEAEMKKFNWLKDFVSYDDSGKITIFDVSEGLLFDAVQQSVVCFFELKEALDTLIVEVEAIDGVDKVKVVLEDNRLVEYYMDISVSTTEWVKNNIWFIEKK